MAEERENWSITLGGRRGWGGFCPGFTENSYPYYGNSNQASAMTDVNLIDSNVLTQGPGIANLTGGDHTGELGEELIVAITKAAATSNVAYACSNDKVFKITNTAVSNANFPKTIAAGTANVATDLIYYRTKVFVFWNDTGVDGDIGLLTNATTWDDDWGSTASDAAGRVQLQDAPHYAIVGGDNVCYVTNGIYIATIAETLLDATALDFWTDSQTVSVTWNNNRLKIAVNRPNVSGSNFNQSGIYTWNGVSSSWEGDPIEVQGEIGALYTKNGITFVWWKDSISTGGYCFGYINGLQLQLLRRYSGSLPNQAQVGEYEGHIAWLSSEKLFLWGAKDADCEVKMFPYMSAKHTTAIGGFAAPFGTPYIASHQYATFTAAATNVITSAAHGLVDDDTIRVTTSDSDLPAGLSAATTYYVIEAATNTFEVSTSEGGSAVDITDAGTGTHTWHQYSLGKASGYSTGARYNTIAFPVSGANFQSFVDLIQVEVETLSTGAKLDSTLTYDKAASTQALTQFAYASGGPTRKKILRDSYEIEDFRLDLSWASGSVTNPVKIRSIFIQGHRIFDN